MSLSRTVSILGSTGSIGVSTLDLLSVAGRKVTVNFENAGKQTIDAAVVTLVFVGDDPRG